MSSVLLFSLAEQEMAQGRIYTAVEYRIASLDSPAHHSTYHLMAEPGLDRHGPIFAVAGLPTVPSHDSHVGACDTQQACNSIPKVKVNHRTHNTNFLPHCTPFTPKLQNQETQHLDSCCAREHAPIWLYVMASVPVCAKETIQPSGKLSKEGIF